MKPVSLCVVGTGAFATGICVSLAHQLRTPATLTIAARSLADAQALAVESGVRARAAGGDLTVDAESVRLDSVESAAEFISRVRPDVVVNVVSPQPPSELHDATGAWPSLVRAAGFAVTLPLQAVLAARLAAAIAQARPDCSFVNAAYPDGVNPVLRAMKLPVLCGLGNVALFDAALRNGLSRPFGELRVVGHHCHLSATPGVPEARAWFGEQELLDVTALLAAARTLPRATANSIAACAAGTFLRKLVSDERFNTSLPGPDGLPGGYPVTVDSGKISVDLPREITLSEAVALNEAWSRTEGAWVTHNGEVRFSGVAADALARHGLDDLAGGFAVADLEDVATTLAEARETLGGLR
ncbi:potassium transporter TrkA [Amycolatopsis thailandensis]|uniref:Potassium transporter TrkA n=1 Tax=Amycolatopsis thailandensis TaxID=589330 RepID=A0A229SIE3_9PSEU|nr:hypothetical protein [Amycolatopsis thailandensis]OXM58501.1 potassium transporter TrkA [Amycolatopsis thailandensis]